MRLLQRGQALNFPLSNTTVCFNTLQMQIQSKCWQNSKYWGSLVQWLFEFSWLFTVHWNSSFGNLKITLFIIIYLQCRRIIWAPHGLYIACCIKSIGRCSEVLSMPSARCIANVPHIVPPLQNTVDDSFAFWQILSMKCHKYRETRRLALFTVKIKTGYLRLTLCFEGNLKNIVILLKVFSVRLIRIY